VQLPHRVVESLVYTPLTVEVGCLWEGPRTVEGLPALSFLSGDAMESEGVSRSTLGTTLRPAPIDTLAQCQLPAYYNRWWYIRCRPTIRYVNKMAEFLGHRGMMLFCVARVTVLSSVLWTE